MFKFDTFPLGGRVARVKRGDYYYLAFLSPKKRSVMGQSFDLVIIHDYKTRLRQSILDTSLIRAEGWAIGILIRNGYVPA